MNGACSTPEFGLQQRTAVVHQIAENIAREFRRKNVFPVFQKPRNLPQNITPARFLTRTLGEVRKTLTFVTAEPGGISRKVFLISKLVRFSFEMAARPGFEPLAGRSNQSALSPGSCRPGRQIIHKGIDDGTSCEIQDTKPDHKSFLLLLTGGVT